MCAWTIDTPGLALDVSVVGRFAYVADFDAGLRVIPERGALLLQLAAGSTLLGLCARHRRVACRRPLPLVLAPRWELP